jgi:hypothetical protein
MNTSKKSGITKTIAIIGTLLVSLPLLAPIIFSLIFLLRSGMFHFDYLMPAEFFPLVLVGGGLLLWSAFRMRSYIKLIGWSYGMAIFLLIASQAIAVLSGLASGKIGTDSPFIVTVIAGIAGYILMDILMTVGGLLMLRDLHLFNGKIER